MHSPPPAPRAPHALAAALLLALGLTGAGCDDAPAADPDRGLAATADSAAPDGLPLDGEAPDGGPPDGGVDAAPDAAPPDGGPPLPPFVACPTPGPLDDRLALNHVMSLGSHNSYHVRDVQVVDPSHDYDHPPLDVQLDEGVRQLELDLHWHKTNGFEVFHLPVIDSATTCRRWVDCLAVLRRWSVAHPCHVPLVVWVEFKDEPLDRAQRDYDPFLDKHADIEADVLSVWPRERLITPDDLRGAHPDLPTALAASGWPTLADTRGKLLLALLDGGAHRAQYLADSPVLADRLMFVDSDDPADPWAATFKINNAVQDADRVQALTEAGFLVTSNVNGAGQPLDERPAALAASVAAAPHHLSTDYVVPDPDTGFVTRLPMGSPACHPRTAPADCTPEAIEPR